MLMQNSGTSSFGYRASLDGKMHYNYTIPVSYTHLTPIAIMSSVPMTIMEISIKQKASTVETMEGEITCLFIRTGSMALG